VRPEEPGRPGLPTGPFPTVGPSSVTMPRWVGWLLIVVGALLGLGALGLASMPSTDDLTLDRTSALWWAVAGGVIFVAGLVYLALRQIRIRRHLAPDRYRGPAILLLLLLVLVAASILTAPFADDAAALVLGEGEMSLVGSLVLLIATQVAMLAVSWLFVFRPRALAGWPSWIGPDPGRALRSGFGWGILAWIGATAASAAALWVLDALGIQADAQAAEQALNVVEPWLAVLAIVILAPIAEELFFRGVVYNAWLREGGRRYALVGSAALFAVIHLSLVAIVPIFLLGLALAWIYRRTANLLAPIAMHATVNGISVALALLVRFEVVPIPV
jgi:membrane protease YdiL (CAAX protease family)